MQSVCPLELLLYEKSFRYRGRFALAWPAARYLLGIIYIRPRDDLDLTSELAALALGTDLNQPRNEYKLTSRLF